MSPENNNPSTYDLLYQCSSIELKILEVLQKQTEALKRLEDKFDAHVKGCGIVTPPVSPSTSTALLQEWHPYILDIEALMALANAREATESIM